ncbi:MAG TPA: HIG1 domain-containing protein [Sphingopyxis sp.]|nr:HIG1 domain-containing protein [Sphingopyxis sp.]HMP46317.1 HIG1 domain-containing protein [Sphingopyxis sp.]HMQ19674.1 HIG1 domain-containing protein [Sphingopyxis sp.]
MQILLVLGVVAAAGLVLFALARGLFYFAQGHRAAIEGTVEQNQAMQNKMMMARVKWQAIAIILVMIIGVTAAAS